MIEASVLAPPTTGLTPAQAQRMRTAATTSTKARLRLLADVEQEADRLEADARLLRRWIETERAVRRSV